jgi:hypothetical protein
LVVWIPAPRRDRGKNEEPAPVEQIQVSVGIALADLLGYVSEIKFDGTTATCLTVYEQ